MKRTTVSIQRAPAPPAARIRSPIRRTRLALRMPRIMSARTPLFLLVAALSAAPAWAQGVSNGAGAFAAAGPYSSPPAAYEILDITVEGSDSESARAIIAQASGLTAGDTVTLPGDETIADAVRSIYRLGLFSDVKIVEERRSGDGVYLSIAVKEEPRLAEYTFSGIKKGQQKDLREEAPLLRGTPVRPSDIERTDRQIKQYYREKGYLLAKVDVRREETADGQVTLDFVIDRGKKVRVEDIRIEGNEAVSDFRLKRKMKKTNENKWWRFWSGAKFDRNEYETDLANIVRHYNDNGYYDARITRDSVFVQEGDDPGVTVELSVEEGPRYYIRDVVWEGNTVYPDDFLGAALGVAHGEAFDRSKLEQNLYQNRNNSDISSLYMNRGYMRFSIEPTIRTVEGDSLDIHFDILEGEVYEFGDVSISGNTKTKEHVVRRELYTIPGRTFSRDAIQESIRRLSQLNYFTQESLGGGPGIDIDEAEKTVDLTYSVVEQSSDQLELSGSWGSFGPILMLRFGFNNFSAQNLFKGSAWDPLPSGDGQQLSLGVQTTGSFYQNYSLSYTEPWFRGRPTPVGMSLSYSSYGGGNRSRSSRLYNYGFSSQGHLRTASARIFYERRLQWPDDKFSMGSALRYQHYDNQDLFRSIPEGVSRIATFQQSLSRNSLDHPIFPSTGSSFSLSLEIAPPVPGFVQYYKTRFKTEWNVPLFRKLSVRFGSDFGYVGSLTGDRVNFERFVVGGSPFDTQGYYNYFGRDIVYMRGYPSAAIGPRLNDEPVGGVVLNKYMSEIKWMAIQTEQLSAQPYAFLDAVNAWDRFDLYNPAELFRSAGVGVRMYLPILRMVELTYGYNFDEFASTRNQDGSKSWRFQFTLGQGF